jgi:hypothetical protein
MWAVSAGAKPLFSGACVVAVTVITATKTVTMATAVLSIGVEMPELGLCCSTVKRVGDIVQPLVGAQARPALTDLRVEAQRYTCIVTVLELGVLCACRLIRCRPRHLCWSCSLGMCWWVGL